MRTNLEKAALLLKYQCCFVNLAGEVSTKLGKHKNKDLEDKLRDMKLSRAYLNRIKAYHTLTNPTISNNSIVINVANTGTGSVAIKVDDTWYTFNGTLTGANIHTYFDSNLPSAATVTLVSATQVTIEDLDTNVIKVNLGSSVSTDTINLQTTYDTDTDDDTLDDLNGLTRAEICGIINHMACILDPYCDCNC